MNSNMFDLDELYQVMYPELGVYQSPRFADELDYAINSKL